MTVPVILYGSSILRRHSAEITWDDDPVQKIKDLFDTLKEKEGIGLAGPQIGVLKRIFVIDTSPLIRSDNTIEKYERAFINPEILDQSDSREIYQEGCLSIPGIYEDVDRPGIIRVKYMDTELNIIEEELDGLIARIFQHEYDHLEGILFIDKLSPIKRTLLQGKLNKIRKISKDHKK